MLFCIIDPVILIYYFFNKNNFRQVRVFKNFFDYINGLINGDDYYLACYDFYIYMEAQKRVDEEYKKSEVWYQECVKTICKMGFF